MFICRRPYASVSSDVTPKEGIIPPGGFHYEDKTQRFRVEGSSYQSVAEAVLRYRLENKLPVGNPLKDVLDYVCTNWPHFCSEHNPPINGGNANPSLSSRVAVWMSSLYRAARTLASSFVASEEAARRAKICEACPFNKEWKTGCGSCLQATVQLGYTFRAGRQTPNEKVLGACDIIGQENATAVWVKGLIPIAPDEYARLPAQCWRK